MFLTPVLPRRGAMLRRVAFSCALALAPATGFAQTATDEAAAAYEAGQRAFANGDFSAAAEFFETADRASPAPQAVIQAIRAHRGVHTPAHDARAATLALALQRREVNDARITAYAARVIDELSPLLARVTVQCDGCDLSLDDRACRPDFFAEPGAHTVTGAWGMRVTHRQLNLLAGSNNPVEITMPVDGLRAPAPPTPPVTPPPTPPALPVDDAERPPAMRGQPPTAERPPAVQPPTPDGLPAGVFVTGTVITLGLAGALVWSGLDTLEGSEQYIANPTQSGLDNGRVRELRTNVLAGATAAAGLTTVLIGAFFTRWRSARPYAGVSPQGVVVGGRF